MLSERLLLGVDVGTTNAKALLATPHGRIVAQATASYGLSTPHPGWVEQDPTDWWRATVEVIRSVVQKAGASPNEVAAIGISGQGCAATLIDQQGNILRPSIIWMDARSEPQCERMRASIGERILSINCKQPAPYNFDPKLIWLQEHEPEMIRRAWCGLTTTGYINFRLTGNAVLNVSDASIPFAFDQRACNWSEELIAAFGLPRNLYPPVAPSQRIVGELLPDVANAVGLQPGIPVIAGGEDTSAAGLSVGAVEQGQAMLSLGTGGSIYTVTETPLAHPQLLTFAHVLERKWFTGGTIVAFGASLAWGRDLLGYNDFEQLTALAAQSEPGARGLIFLPYLSGELQPINDGNARGVFFGLSLATGQPELVRAIMEGVAFAMAHNILVAREAGATVNELRAVGGPTRSPLWCQIIADITGLPLIVLKDNPGAPLGDVFLAAAAIGLISDAGQSAAQATTVDCVYAPRPETQRLYRDLFATYRSLYPDLKARFVQLAEQTCWSSPKSSVRRETRTSS